MKIADVISMSKEKMLCGSVIKMMVSFTILSTNICRNETNDKLHQVEKITIALIVDTFYSRPLKSR